MQTHRFYLPPEQCRGSRLQLGGREAHHALRVLRLRPGDRATVLDGAGGEFLCEVEGGSPDALALRVAQKICVASPPCSITLLVGIPKGKIIESIIQKAAELGARRVVPLLTERVVTRLDEAGRAHKREQWQQVAVEAIKQCGAAWLPEIEAPATIAEVLARNEKFELSLAGSLQAERRPPGEVFRAFARAAGRLPKTAAAWIGPEGDFTPGELQAIQQSGAQPVSLGRLTLRVETAAIYCLAILDYELNSVEPAHGSTGQ